MIVVHLSMYRNGRLPSRVLELIVSLVVLGENLSSEIWPGVACNLSSFGLQPRDPE